MSHRHSFRVGMCNPTDRCGRHDSFELTRKPLGLSVRVGSSSSTNFGPVPWDCLRISLGSDVDSRPRSYSACWIPKQDLFGPDGCGCGLMMVDVSLYCPQKIIRQACACRPSPAIHLNHPFTELPPSKQHFVAMWSLERSRRVTHPPARRPEKGTPKDSRSRSTSAL